MSVAIDVVETSLRERILDAALVLCREPGRGVPTIREIAAGAEIGLATLYYYFDGKAAIIDELRARAATRIEHELSRALGDGGTREELLLRICVFYANTVRGHAAVSGSAERAGTGDVDVAWRACAGKITELLVGRDRIVASSVDEALTFLHVGINGLTQTVARTKVCSPTAVERYVRTLLAGL